MVRLPVSGTNRVYTVGENYGSLQIASPVAKANQLIARDLHVQNGLVANDAFFTSHLRSTNITTDLLTICSTNPTPANPTTVRAWVQVKVGGQSYKVPLYQ